MSISVLQRATRADVRRDPFPHIVIEKALPDQLVEALIEEYPSLEVMDVDPSESNTRWSYPAEFVAGSPAISETWKQVIAYHASPAFFHELVDVFGAEILRAYPQRFQSLEQLTGSRVGIREKDSFADHDFLLDAQISGNTAVREESSVKTTHVDSNRKLFSGLFYLRHPEDDSIGGDLTIARFKPGLSRWEWRRRFDGVFVPEELVEAVKTVRYERNTLVIFLNTLDSMHGVTVREPTPHLRLFMNLVCEVHEPLFDVPQAWEIKLGKLHKIAAKRVRRAVGR
jgi:hypothetical protein